MAPLSLLFTIPRRLFGHFQFKSAARILPQIEQDSGGDNDWIQL